MAPPKTKLEVPKYKAGQDIEDYLRVFELIVDSNGLTAQQKKTQLLICFEIGTLHHRLVRDAHERESFVDIKTRLVSTFKGKYSEFDSMASFKKRVQLRSESVMEFKESLTILFLEAGGSMEGLDSNPFFRDHLLNGFLPSIQEAVKRELPKTVTRMMNLAQTAEAALGLSARSAFTMHVTSQEAVASCPSEFAAVPSSASSGFSSCPTSAVDSVALYDKVLSSLKSIEDRLSSLEIKQTEHAELEQIPRQGSQVNRGGTRQRRGSVRCFRCSRTGHIASECRAPWCARCQQVGHMSRDCQTQTQSNRSPSRSPNRSSQQWRPMQSPQYRAPGAQPRSYSRESGRLNSPPRYELREQEN